jgi:hypothetical protein
MNPTTKVILIGSMGYLMGFLQQLLSYVQGLKDHGGTWEDFSGIAVLSYLLTSLTTAIAALMVFLAEPPNKKSVPPEINLDIK